MTELVSNRDRSVARWLLGGATLLVAFYCLHTVAGVAPAGQWIELGVYHLALLACVAACLLRGLRGGRRARGWVLLGLALACWTLADVYWQIWLKDSNTIPSPADVGYLAVYPLAYAAVLMLARARGGAGGVARWLDGVIGGLAVASVAAAIVVSAVTDAFGGDTLENVTNLAYPLGDGILLALIVGTLAVTGWRLGRMWLLMSLGLTVFAAADSAYLYLVATGTYHGGLRRLRLARGHPAHRLVGLAARPARGPARPRGAARPRAPGRVRRPGPRRARLRPRPARGRARRRAGHGQRHRRHGPDGPGHGRERPASRAHARAGLERRADRPGQPPPAPRRPRRGGRVRHPAHAMLFDLNGFKTYNDTFGHPAGDSLLRQLGRRLGAAAAGHGGAYRLGGDEFCLLVEGEPLDDGLLEAALGALRLRGDAFSIDAARAWPSPRRGQALRRCPRPGRRAHVRGQGRGPPIGRRQSTDVLLRVLQERHPDLRQHLLGVAGLAREVGELMGLERRRARRRDLRRRAARRGKVAIPKAILDKPGGLDPEERAFMDRHTIDRAAHRRGGARAGAVRRSCARATSAGTGAATPTAWPGRTSRSAPASWPCATPSRP